jgi:hypothetical protein
MSYILSFPLPSHIRKNEVQDRIHKLSNDKRSLRYTNESNTIIIRSSDFDQIIEAKNDLETQAKSCISKHGDKYIGKYPIHPDIVSQRLISRTIGRSGCFINEIQSKVCQDGSVRIHVGDKKDNYFYTITALDTKQVENAYELLQKNEFAVLYDTAKQSKHTATVPTASSDVNKKSNGGSSDSSDKLVRKFSISDDIQKYKLFSPLIGQRGSCLDKITSQVKTKSYISVSKDTLEYTIGSGSLEDMETIYGLLIEHEQKVIDSYLSYKQQRHERQRQEQQRFTEESDSASDDDEKHTEVESKTIECPPSPRKEPRKKTPSEKTEKSSSWADLLDDDEYDEEIGDILDNLQPIKRN